MPMGVFDESAMKELVALKREFIAFMDWDASFAYTPSALLEPKTLCSAPNEADMHELQKMRSQVFFL